jgi:hypothetical protein
MKIDTTEVNHIVCLIGGSVKDLTERIEKRLVLAGIDESYKGLTIGQVCELKRLKPLALAIFVLPKGGDEVVETFKQIEIL